MSIREYGRGDIFDEGRGDPLKKNPRAKFLFDVAVEENLAYRDSTRIPDRVAQRAHKIRSTAAEELLGELFTVDKKGHSVNPLFTPTDETPQVWRRKIVREVSKREHEMIKAQQDRWRAEIAQGLSGKEKIVFMLTRSNAELVNRKRAFDIRERLAEDLRAEDIQIDYLARTAYEPEDIPPMIELETRDLVLEKKKLFTEYLKINPWNSKRKKEH